MNSAIEIVNRLVQIGKTLRDATELIKDAQTKNLIADLNLSLADLKMQVATLQEENLELCKTIKSLETADDVRSSIELRDAAYWFINNIPQGRPAGPYCTGCFDSGEKLIVLSELSHPFSDIAKYKCPTCKQTFGKGRLGLKLGM